MPSTVISYFMYDAVKKILQVKFVSGLIYNYLEVPEYIYNAMKTAKSKGSYFNRNIKERFMFERMM